MKPKTKKTKFAIGTLMAALVFLSIGCGGNTKAEKVTLKVWKPFVESNEMQTIISDFQKQYPNVKIEYTKKNIENYESDLTDALAAGEGPDVYSINNTWLPRYANKVAPAPDKLFTVKEFRETFVDAISNDFIVDNKIYGTAMWVDSLGLYYNKDLMGTAGIATPPKTWLELAQHVRRITRQDETGYFNRSGVAMGTNSNVNRGVDIVYLLMLQAGVVPWSADGSSPQFANSVRKGNTSVPAGKEALEFYTSFTNPNSENYTWNETSDYSTDAFANGRAAYLYGYAYTRAQIDSKAPNLNYDVAPVPQYNLTDPSVNYANYFAEVVNKQSKHTAEAWNFIKFITSKASLDKYYAKDKQPSSRRDLIELQTNDTEIGVFAHANLTAKSFYKSDEAKFDGIIATMIENVVLKGQSVEQALSQAQNQASRLPQTRQ